MSVMLDIQILGMDGSRAVYVAEYKQFKNMERSEFASKNTWKRDLYRFLFFQSGAGLAL